MFGLASDITGIIKEVSGRLIGHFFPDKEEQQKKQLEVDKMIVGGEFKRIENGFKVMQAEAESNDKWTSRARPSFMYVMYIMILASIPLGALFVYDPRIAKEFIAGVNLWFRAIPTPLYVLFGACYSGYTAARSYDKKKILDLLKRGGFLNA